MALRTKVDAAIGGLGRAVLPRKRPKVFVIGRNKTGTTSMAAALVRIGFRVGDQHAAERLMEDWARRDFAPIVDYCRGADAFQDAPFSLDFTWQAMDQAFPGSKFVLTVRRDADEWFRSLVDFHARLLRVEGRPTADDYKRSKYLAPGWLWRQQQLVYGVDEKTLLDETLYKRHYELHRERVADYFRHRPADLLVLNVGDADAMERLCAFLGVTFVGEAMPHKNKRK